MLDGLGHQHRDHCPSVGREPPGDVSTCFGDDLSLDIQESSLSTQIRDGVCVWIVKHAEHPKTAAGPHPGTVKLSLDVHTRDLDLGCVWRLAAALGGRELRLRL